MAINVFSTGGRHVHGRDLRHPDHRAGDHPVLPTFGIDFMHFGLLMTVNLAIGYRTPPVGVSMYITGAMANKDIILLPRP